MINLIDVSKKYKTLKGEHQVFDKANLTIQKGERLGIHGENGSGKSTLIKLISGAEDCNNGTIIRKMTVSWPLGFGGGFQSGLSGADNINFIARIYNKNINELTAEVDDFAELGKFLKEPVKSYSSGMRARLAFGLSIAIRFDCLLIDEVIAVGDSRFQKKCREKIFSSNNPSGFVLVTHNSDLIKETCSTTATIIDKKIHRTAHD